jgi:hypothetical protein
MVTRSTGVNPGSACSHFRAAQNPLEGRFSSTGVLSRGASVTSLNDRD